MRQSILLNFSYLEQSPSISGVIDILFSYTIFLRNQIYLAILTTMIRTETKKAFIIPYLVNLRLETMRNIASKSATGNLANGELVPNEYLNFQRMSRDWFLGAPDYVELFMKTIQRSRCERC